MNTLQQQEDSNQQPGLIQQTQNQQDHQMMMVVNANNEYLSGQRTPRQRDGNLGEGIQPNSQQTQLIAINEIHINMVA